MSKTATLLSRLFSPTSQEPTPETVKKTFNFNKLLVALCISTSAAIAIGAIYWVIKFFM